MAECCCPPDVTHQARTCSACAAKTSAVDLATIKALLTPKALARLDLVTFRFCPESTCDVVYVADAGQVFRVDDLRVPVWQKLPPGDRTLCYCFGENERDLQHEIDTHGSTDVITRVRAHIAERRCACDVQNPRGSCCLGDLAVAVARLRQDARS
jgi:hypothetical protein